MANEAREHLSKHWLHSHEEDTPTEMVFRPSTFAFPPSRGRSGFVLNSDGTATAIGISPRDGGTATPGSWALEGDQEQRIALSLNSGDRRELRVVSIDAERLVVRKPAP